MVWQGSDCFLTSQILTFKKSLVKIYLPLAAKQMSVMLVMISVKKFFFYESFLCWNWMAVLSQMDDFRISPSFTIPLLVA